VVHGNGFDVNKKVTLRLCWELGCLSVEVLDEGDGFRLEAVPDPRLQENRERWSGRGVAIARQIMDEFHVEKNLPRGACVRMVKRLKV
jgi:anti-sigma regulatory factor (Ser/Thr protein kinase)